MVPVPFLDCPNKELPALSLLGVASLNFGFGLNLAGTLRSRAVRSSAGGLGGGEQHGDVWGVPGSDELRMGMSCKTAGSIFLSHKWPKEPKERGERGLKTRDGVENRFLFWSVGNWA